MTSLKEIMFMKLRAGQFCTSATGEVEPEIV